MFDAQLTKQALALLCPPLRRILDEELVAGNAVVEVWSHWGEGVLLARPFLLEHAECNAVQFRPINDPHYWKAEYICETTGQILACRF